MQEFWQKPQIPLLPPVPSRSARPDRSHVSSERAGWDDTTPRSWEAQLFLISLKKLRVIVYNHFSQRYDQKKFQVPVAEETWISDNFIRFCNLSLMELWYYRIGSINDCYNRKKKKP